MYDTKLLEKFAEVYFNKNLGTAVHFLNYEWNIRYVERRKDRISYVKSCIARGEGVDVSDEMLVYLYDRYFHPFEITLRPRRKKYNAG
jgi:hypothetical protein